MTNGAGERKNRNENTFFNVTITPTYELSKEWKITSHFSYYLNRNSQAYYRPNIGLPSFAIENLGTAIPRRPPSSRKRRMCSAILMWTGTRR